VLEDDAIPMESFRQFMKEKHYLRFNMVFLAHGDSFVKRYQRHKLFGGISVYYAAMNPWLTTGYTINAHVAKILIENMIPIRFPADNWPCDLAKMEAVVAHPSIIRLDGRLESEIGHRLGPDPVPKNFRRYFSFSYYFKKANKCFFWKRIPSSYLPDE